MELSILLNYSVRLGFMLDRITSVMLEPGSGRGLWLAKC